MHADTRGHGSCPSRNRMMLVGVADTEKCVGTERRVMTNSPPTGCERTEEKEEAETKGRDLRFKGSRGEIKDEGRWSTQLGDFHEPQNINKAGFSCL